MLSTRSYLAAYASCSRTQSTCGPTTGSRGRLPQLTDLEPSSRSVKRQLVIRAFTYHLPVLTCSACKDGAKEDTAHLDPTAWASVHLLDYSLFPVPVSKDLWVSDWMTFLAPCPLEPLALVPVLVSSHRCRYVYSPLFLLIPKLILFFFLLCRTVTDTIVTQLIITTATTRTCTEVANHTAVVVAVEVTEVAAVTRTEPVTELEVTVEAATISSTPMADRK